MVRRGLACCALLREPDMLPPLTTPVRPSTHDATGLDFVWPFLLRYPKDRIAVIDEVCARAVPCCAVLCPEAVAADEGVLALCQVPLRKL